MKNVWVLKCDCHKVTTSWSKLRIIYGAAVQCALLLHTMYPRTNRAGYAGRYRRYTKKGRYLRPNTKRAVARVVNDQIVKYAEKKRSFGGSGGGVSIVGHIDDLSGLGQGNIGCFPGNTVV